MRFQTPISSVLVGAFALALLPAAIVGLLLFFALAAAGWVFGVYWLVLFGLMICLPVMIPLVFARVASVVEFDEHSVTASFRTGRRDQFMLSDILEVRKRRLWGSEHQVTIHLKNTRKFVFLTDHRGVRQLQTLLQPHRLYVI